MAEGFSGWPAESFRCEALGVGHDLDESLDVDDPNFARCRRCGRKVGGRVGSSPFRKLGAVGRTGGVLRPGGANYQRPAVRRLRELRLLLACARDEVLDAWDAIRRWRRRAWCKVFGHGRPVQRPACVTCDRCGAVVAQLSLGVVQAVQREDGRVTVRLAPGVAEELKTAESALSVGFHPKKGDGRT